VQRRDKETTKFVAYLFGNQHKKEQSKRQNPRQVKPALEVLWALPVKQARNPNRFVLLLLVLSPTRSVVVRRGCGCANERGRRRGCGCANERGQRRGCRGGCRMSLFERRCKVSCSKLTLVQTASRKQQEAAGSSRTRENIQLPSKHTDYRL
jgi:hypothetical protein